MGQRVTSCFTDSQPVTPEQVSQLNASSVLTDDDVL